MIAPQIIDEMRRRLTLAEAEHRVKVLLAVESGSRAWGFASSNSDYDGRFIYINQPDWYMSVSLEEQRDVIEYPIVDEMDINGWDLRKALRLFWKSNPGFVEWIQSPVVYQSAGSFQARARELLPQIYSIERGVHHYRSMAKTNYRGYLQTDSVPLKKYFYVLRPLLSVRWLLRERTPAPIKFRQLLIHLDGDKGLLSAIEQLLEIKSRSPEMGMAAPVPIIQNFIETELQNQTEIQLAKDADKQDRVELLNVLFRQLLAESWG